MCAGVLVHISRHLCRMSNNNNKRCQLYIHCMLAEFAFIRFYIRFLVYDYYYIIVAYILLYRLYSIPPVSWSCLIIPRVLPAWYHLSCLLSPACFCSRHGFQCMIMIRFYRYTYAYPCTPSGFLPHHSPGEFSSDSPASSCPGHGAWSVWILPVADQSGAAVAWIPSRPSRALSFQAPPAWL